VVVVVVVVVAWVGRLSSLSVDGDSWSWSTHQRQLSRTVALPARRDRRRHVFLSRRPHFSVQVIDSAWKCASTWTCSQSSVSITLLTHLCQT